MNAPERSDPLVIRPATTARDIEIVRALFAEYAAWLKVDLCFQGFDEELAGLPGAYAPPAGRLFLACAGGEVAGCVALRPLKRALPLRSDPESGPEPGPEPGPNGVCELKRLWVRPAFRGRGIGRALSAAALAAARDIGYREIKLDTLAAIMPDAVAMYRSLGFAECAPYYHNPIPGTLYMSRAL